jgi:hypothetical protein
VAHRTEIGVDGVDVARLVDALAARADPVASPVVRHGVALTHRTRLDLRVLAEEQRRRVVHRARLVAGAEVDHRVREV